MASDIDIRIGENIRHARSWAGLSQKKLGEHLGVSSQQVSKFENGIDRVSSSQLLLIAEKVGVRVTELMTGVAEELPTNRSDHTFMRDYQQLSDGSKATLRELVRAIVTDTARRLKA